MKQLHIISTEDDSLIRRILAELVTPEGHEIQFARNSDDLFSLLVKRAWDLIILDVNVPGMNGYQIAREICARYGDKRPKILIFTGRNTKAEQGLAAVSGADAILEKGCPLPLLVETINRLGGNLPPPCRRLRLPSPPRPRRQPLLPPPRRRLSPGKSLWLLWRKSSRTWNRKSLPSANGWTGSPPRACRRSPAER